MSTEEKDEQQQEQSRPRKVIPSIRRDNENDWQGGNYERRPYHSPDSSRGNYANHSRPSSPRRSNYSQMPEGKDNFYRSSPYGNREQGGNYERRERRPSRDYYQQGGHDNYARSSNYTHPNTDGEKPIRRKRPRVGESARITPYGPNREERPRSYAPGANRERREYNSNYRPQERWNNNYPQRQPGGFNKKKEVIKKRFEFPKPVKYKEVVTDRSLMEAFFSSPI